MKLSRRAVDRVVSTLLDAPLGDPRRQRRVVEVAKRMARAPAASLPAALCGDAEVQGCYRLLNNPAVTFDALLVPQAEATRVRAEAAGGEVLVLHDTTDCSFPHLDPDAIGYLQTGKAGFRLHLSLVVEAGAWRRPLGVVHAEIISREQKSRRQTGGRSVCGVETARWQDRESRRWWQGVSSSQQWLAGCDRVVHVADREGDSYELLAKMVQAGWRFVVRVRVDRRGRSVEDQTASWSTVRQVASEAQGLLEREVPLSRRKGKNTARMRKAHPPRKQRMARLRFSATRVVIPRPVYLRDPVAEQLELNLVHVHELDPPDGEPPVDWLLYTTESVDNAAQCERVVDIYRTRWVIEEFNAALKTGCAYEDREFETLHALLNALAISLPIACELLWLRSRARDTPLAPATDVLTPRQLEVLDALGARPLGLKPTAQDALLAVAALGGHLKRNGPPGWHVLQRGFERLLAYEVGWAAAKARHRRGRKM